MATQFVLRPPSMSLTFVASPRFLLNSFSLSKSLSFSLLSTATTALATTSTTSDQAFFYGPSLHKGQKPSHFHLSEPLAIPSTTAQESREEQEELEEREFNR
ncbi:hypothetical protein NMG60_11037151 [Bertholletia excelsa]